MSSEDSEDDLHQCGRCMLVFHNISEYFDHKKSKSCTRIRNKFNSDDSSMKLHQDVGLQPASEPQRTIFEEVETGRSIKKGAIELSNKLTADTSGVEKLSNNSCDEVCSVKKFSSGSHVENQSDDKPVKARNDDHSRSISGASDSEIGPNEHISLSEVPTSGTSQKWKRGRPPKSIAYNKILQLKKPVHWNSKSRLYQCPKCCYVASFKDDYDRHLRKSHNLSAYVCYRCQKAFSDKYKLKRHLQKLCQREPLQAQVPAFTEFSKKTGQCTKPVHCTSDEVLQVIRKIDFSCHICGELCDSYNAVLLHMTKHQNIRPGICKFCGLWFSNRYKLRRHVVSSIHDNVADDQMQAFRKEVEKMKIVCPAGLIRSKLTRRQMSCSKCGKTFVSQTAYSQHKECGHVKKSDVTLYVCKLCSGSFESSKKYLLHLKTGHQMHSSSPKQCPVCNRKFLHRSHLNRHRLTLHSPSQQIPKAAISKHSSDAAAVVGEKSKDDLKYQFSVESSVNEDTAELTPACFVCQQRFLDKDLIKEHIEFHRVWIPRPLENPVSANCFDSFQSLPVVKTFNESMSNDNEIDVQNNCEEESFVREKEAKLRGSDIETDISMLKNLCTGNIEPVCSKRNTSKSCFSCPYCHEDCDDLQALFEHKTNKHKLDCVFCCVLSSCKLVFQTVEQFMEHSKVHPQLSFICKICNGHFESKRDLFSHRQCSHKSIQPVIDNDISSNVEASNLKLKSCETAGQNSSRQSPKNVCSSKKTKENKTGNIAKRKGRLCDQCGSVFEGKIALCCRKEKPVSERRFTCSICNRAFNKKEHLQRHQISTHATAKPFVCREPGCAKAFKRKDKLQDHFKCHSSIKPYSCSVCGRKYRYREGLRYHEKMHEKEQRYKCSECSVSFPRPSELRQHLSSMHKLDHKKEIYTYHCNICSRVFPRPERLKRHSERDHSIAANWVFRCDVCCKGFPGIKSYETHKVRHHGSVDSGVPNCAKQRRCKSKDLLHGSFKPHAKSFLAKENVDLSGLKWPEDQSPSDDLQLDNPSDSPDSERACQVSEVITSADNGDPFYQLSTSQNNDFPESVSTQLLSTNESKAGKFFSQPGFSSLPALSPDRRFSGYNYIQTPGYNAVDYASSSGNDGCSLTNTEEQQYDSIQDMDVVASPESNRILRCSSQQQPSSVPFTNTSTITYPCYPSSRISQSSAGLHASLGFYHPRSNSYRAATNGYSFSSEQFSSAKISFSFARANTFSQSSSRITGKTSDFSSGPVSGQFGFSDHASVPFRPVAMPTQPSKPPATNETTRFGRWFSNVPLLANSYDAKQTMFDAVRLSRLPATDRTAAAGHPFSMSCHDPYMTSRYSTERQCMPRDTTGTIDQRSMFMDYGFMSDEHATTVRRDDHFNHCGSSALHPVSSHVPGTMPTVHMPLSLLSQQQQQFPVNDYQWPAMPMYNWL